MLAQIVPAPVPLPRWRVLPGDPVFRFGVIGYPKLPGQPLDRANATTATALELADFLRTLHTYPHEQLAPLDVPTAPLWHERVAQLETVLPRVARALDATERDVLRTWWNDALADEEMETFAPTLRHGDLWYGNVLVDAGGIAGVLDWEEAAVGDAAEDLAPQYYLGDPFAASLLDAYGADDAVRHRMRRYRELREFSGLRWALEQRDDRELAESLAKIRRSPIFWR